MNHRWGDKRTYLNKSEKDCVRCGVTMASFSQPSPDGPIDVRWKEFWRDGEQIRCEATPPCQPSKAGMTVYVDNVRHSFGRMVMCHMWADSLDELLSMADRIGVARRWLQQPPKASWVHFDIAQSKKALAIASGAVVTDRFGPLEHVARLTGDAALLERIAHCREIRARA